MDYHIFLDGEKVGELSDAEYARLRKEARMDARTWGSFGLAQAVGTWKCVVLMMRFIGIVGGMAFVMGLVYAPQVLQMLEQMLQQGTAAEVAAAIGNGGKYLTLVVMLAGAGLLTLSPKTLGVPNAFEKEFVRRVRRLKRIQKHGRLEVLGFTLPQGEVR